jgi:uncharacterized protein (DUF1330 family)
VVAAYVIVDEVVTDPSRFEEYRRLAGPSMTKYGARFLVRGGDITPLEGDWMPKRLVVLEFDSVERARAWYDSPEYQAALRARDGGAISKVLIAQGT